MAGKHKGERNAKGEGRAGKPEAAKKQPRPQETSSGVLDFGFPGEGSPSAHTLAPPALRASRRGGVFGRPVTVGATTILPVVSRIRVGSAIRVDRPVGVYVIDREGRTRWVPSVDLVALAAVAHAAVALALVVFIERRRRGRRSR